MSQITLDQIKTRMSQLEAIYMSAESTPWQTETARGDLNMYCRVAKDLYNHTYEWPKAEQDDEPYPSVSFGVEVPNGGFEGLKAAYGHVEAKAFEEVAWQPPVQEQLPPPTFARDFMATRDMVAQGEQVHRDIDNTLRAHNAAVVERKRKPYIVPADAKIGVCITTHASMAYVDLSIHALKHSNPNVKIMVHDDASWQKMDLSALCVSHSIAFTSTGSRRDIAVGDSAGMAAAIRWGQQSGLDVVIKCSRRFIINRPIEDGLRELLHGSGYETATAPDESFGFGFRSELVALAVKPWIDSGAIDELESGVRMNRLPDWPAEAWHHKLARKVHAWNHPINTETSNPAHPDYDPVVGFDAQYKRPDNYDGYAIWPMLGLRRKGVMPGIIWHNNPNCEGSNDEDVKSYMELSEYYGLGWTANDFRHVPGE